MTDWHKTVKFENQFLYVGKMLVGEIAPSDDGYQQFWPMNREGYWPSWLLRAIADKLDEMNREWDQQVAKGLGGSDATQSD